MLSVFSFLKKKKQKAKYKIKRLAEDIKYRDDTPKDKWTKKRKKERKKY